MTRQASVFFNGILAGTLAKVESNKAHTKSHFVFTYDEVYLSQARPSIALDMPRRAEPYHSDFLFPFFEGLLPEGESRTLFCMQQKIDPRDSFSLLLKLAGKETIGAVTVMKDA